MTENFQKILLSPLFMGRETEYKLHLWLDSNPPEKMNVSPFKQIVFEDGVRCFEAELECGDGFLTKKVFLGLIGENPPNKIFHSELMQLIKASHLPKQVAMAFGDEYPFTIFPLLYCREKNDFMAIPTKDKGKPFSQLLASIDSSEEADDYACVNCAERPKCFGIERNVEQALSIFNAGPAGLFLLDNYPLNLLESSQLIGCSDTEDRALYLENLAEQQPARVDYLKGLTFQSYKERNVTQTTVEKLRLFESVINYLKSLVQENKDVLSIFQHDQLYVNDSCATSQTLTLSLLPFSSKKPIEHQETPNGFNSATARIFEEQQSYCIEFRKNLSDLSVLAVGDRCLIELEDDGSGSARVFCQVNRVENDFYQLDLQLQKDQSLEDVLVCFPQEMFKPVKYLVVEKMPVLSDQLFMCFLSILLKNSVLEEQELRHAQQILLPLLKTQKNLNANDMAQMINTNSALSVVFRQENIYYKPSTKVGYKLSSIHWLKIIVWMCQTAYYFEKSADEKESAEIIEFFDSACNELGSLIDEIEACVLDPEVETDDQDEILKKVLTELIADEVWLNAVLALDEPDETPLHIVADIPDDDSRSSRKDEVPLQASNHKLDQDNDRTMIMPANNASRNR